MWIFIKFRVAASAQALHASVILLLDVLLVCCCRAQLCEPIAVPLYLPFPLYLPLKACTHPNCPLGAAAALQMFVKFRDAASAQVCRDKIHGRLYGGQQVQVCVWLFMCVAVAVAVAVCD